MNNDFDPPLSETHKILSSFAFRSSEKRGCRGVDDTLAGYLNAKVPVTIYYNNECGVCLWSASVDSDPEFWIYSSPSLKKVIKFCEKYNLPFKVDLLSQERLVEYLRMQAD